MKSELNLVPHSHQALDKFKRDTVLRPTACLNLAIIAWGKGEDGTACELATEAYDTLSKHSNVRQQTFPSPIKVCQQSQMKFQKCFDLIV